MCTVRKARRSDRMEMVMVIPHELMIPIKYMKEGRYGTPFRRTSTKSGVSGRVRKSGLGMGTHCPMRLGDK